jgi:hypothetical protein
MMKNLLIILFTGLFSTAAVAQSKPVQYPLTTIEFESTTVDYGKIEKGSMALEHLLLETQETIH